MIEVNESCCSEITDSEFIVMSALWDLGPSTAQEIVSQITTKKSWGEPTIKTLLGRLVKKDVVSTLKNGRKFIYSSKVSERELREFMENKLIEIICNSQHCKVLEELISMMNLNTEEIDRLIGVLRTKRV